MANVADFSQRTSVLFPGFARTIFSLSLLISGSVYAHVLPASTNMPQKSQQEYVAASANTFHAPANASAKQPSGRHFSFEFHDEPLDAALYAISRATGVDILYESRHTAGIRITSNFRDETLSDILEGMLSPEGLEARRIRTGMYIVQFSLRKQMPPLTEIPKNNHSDFDREAFLAHVIILDAVSGDTLQGGFRLISNVANGGGSSGKGWVILAREGYFATRVPAAWFYGGVRQRDAGESGESGSTNSRTDAVSDNRTLLLPLPREIHMKPLIPVRERVIF